MSYQVSKVEVWAGDIPNHPGTLANVLDALKGAGADMEFMIARKLDENMSRVFIAPVKGSRVQKAAMANGFSKAQNLHGMRVEGPDKPGTGALLTRAVANAGVNLRGASAAGLGKTAVFYLAVESEGDLQNAMKAGKSALHQAPKKAAKPSKKSKTSGSKRAKAKTSGSTKRSTKRESVMLSG